MIDGQGAEKLIGIKEGQAVLSIIGCGGKTTFSHRMARTFAGHRVLISPTTKIRAPMDEDIVLCDTLLKCERHLPRQGIQCMGIGNGITEKLEALPLPFLEKQIPQYDVVLLEADGSKGLPCKGWADFEPVIPDFSTHTVGIVTLGGLGRKVGADTVHRISLFTELTGKYEGDVITIQTLRDMISHPKGMFQKSRGEKVLLINQVENEEAVLKAKELAISLKNHWDMPVKILYGSAQQNKWKEA